MLRLRPALGPVFAVVLTTLACSSGPSEELLAEFRQARRDALAEPGPAPAGWRPDAVLQLSPDLVQRLVDVGVGQLEPATWDVDVKGLSLTPKLALTRAGLSASDRCETCFVVDLEVKGPIRYDAGILGKGRIPTTLSADVDLELEVGSRADDFVVTATVKGVRKVRAELDGVPSAISDLAEPHLTSLVREQVKDLDPFELARPGAASLPLRALRVRPVGEGVALELLTEAGVDAAVSPGPVEGDWTLDVAEAALVRLVAREGFRAGPQDYGLIGELRGLAIRKGDLELDVRVWRTEGNGWWRDLHVTAAADVRPRKLKLSATAAEVTASSPGAALADPVAWLAESIVLDELQKAAAIAIPTVEEAELGGVEAKVRLEGFGGGKGTLRTWGGVRLE